PPLDQRLDAACRHGLREQEALAEVALQLEQAARLLLAFDPFRNDLDAEAAAEVDHRVDDSLVARVVRHVAHEALIDLDQVDLELLEVAQRRVAGPEIVERDLDAAQVEQREGAMDVLGAAPEEHGLGDLDLEAARRDLRALQPLEQMLGEVVAAEFGGCGVDRDIAEVDPP